MSAFGVYTADTATTISSGYSYYYRSVSLSEAAGYVDLANLALYFVVSIMVLVFAALIFVKERSTVSTA